LSIYLPALWIGPGGRNPGLFGFKGGQKVPKILTVNWACFPAPGFRPARL
jgi:hypothetical protein